MTIACINIPEFTVATERQRQDDTASQPILIGERTVFDCSRAAEALNVRRGMRMSEAIALCGHATVLPLDIPHYQRRFDEILDLLEEVSPEVEASHLGTAYASLKGLRIEPQAFAEEFIASLRRTLGFSASIGIARGKFLAKVAAYTSQPGTAKTISVGQEKAFLATLPVSYLPASEAMQWRLRLLGLETMEDISRLPLQAFQQQFGLEGKRCWELANGVDDEPVHSRVKEEIITQRLELPAPTASLETILLGAERLLRAVYAKKELKSRWARKAIVRATLETGGAWELPVAFHEALANPRDAWIAVKAAAERRPPEQPVEQLEVELVGLTFESGRQTTMLEEKGRLWRQVEEAIQQFRVRQVALSVGNGAGVEPWSRIPERRTALAAYNL